MYVQKTAIMIVQHRKDALIVHHIQANKPFSLKRKGAML